METRCPLCHAPIDVAESSPDVLKTISSVECPNCGLVPLQGVRSTVTFKRSTERQTIGHFQLVRILGSGSFGTVWLAVDTDLGRNVALKLAPHEDKDEATLLHEAQAAANLRHPNIVRVYEVGTKDGWVYIASELIDGINLRDLMSAGRPNTERAVEMVLAVAKALQHAHERGIVHRDIKPSNIMLNAQGEPFVADFGLAKRLSNEASISSEGAILGTALYMSPEQARGQTAGIDGRTDLYALGTTLFELLTGHVPFRGNIHALLHQKIHEDIPSPRSLNPKIPKDLETICQKCCERDPDKRYRSAQELADELQRFKTGVPIKARPVTSLEKAWRWCLRNKAVSGLLTGLILSMALGLAFVTFYWRKSVANANLANRRLYRAEMNLVSQYYYKGDINGVKRTLDRFEADEDLARLRGFAWHYHKRAIEPFLQVSSQGDPVVDVAVFPDARFYAACGNNQQTRVWDTKSGELVRTLTIESDRFQALAVSPANSHLATASTDGRIRIWNPLKDDRTVQQMQHGPAARIVRYSRDGKLLLSAGKKGLVQIWDVATGKSINSFPSGQSGNVDVRFSPDGKTVAVATKDGRIRIRDTKTGEEQIILSPVASKRLNASMESMVWSDDGKTIVTGSNDGKIRIWSVETGERLHEHHTSLGLIGDLEFIDKTLLAVPTIGGQLMIFDTVSRRSIHRLRTHSLTGGILDRSANGRVLIVGSGGGSVKLLDVAALREPTRFWHRRPEDNFDQSEEDLKVAGKRPGNPARGVAFLPGGTQFIAAVAESGISVWKTSNANRRKIKDLGKQERITAMTVDPTGKFVIAAILKESRIEKKPQIEESHLRMWNIESGKLVESLDFGKSRVAAVAFSSRGDHFAVAEATGKLSVLKTDDWKTPVFEKTPLESGVNAVIFSPDNSRLVAACRDGSVVFVDVTTGKPVGETLSVRGMPLTLAYCEDGKLLAVGTETGEIQLREAADGTLRRTILAHASRVNVLAAFPHGRTIVSGGRDQELKLWDTESGESITTLYGHRRQITCLAISADGKTIASGGLMGDVLLWRGN